MKKQILILLLFVPAILYSQQTKKIRNNAENETFYVLKSDKQIRHGEYMKFWDKKLFVKGYYNFGIKDSIWEYGELGGLNLKFNIKDSIWEYFDKNGQLALKYDYANNDSYFYKFNDVEKNKKFMILDERSCIDTVPFIPANLLEDMYSIFVRNLRYPQKARDSRKTGKVIVNIIIDECGAAYYPHVKTPIGYGFDEEAIRIVKLIPDNFWNVRVFNEQPVNYIVKIPVNFNMNF